MSAPTTQSEPLGMAAELEDTAGQLDHEPRTLLQMADIFERYGSPRTARLLRGCADRVMALTPLDPEGAVAVPLSRWTRSDGRHSVIVAVDEDVAQRLQLGARYELVPAPAHRAEPRG